MNYPARFWHAFDNRPSSLDEAAPAEYYSRWVRTEHARKEQARADSTDSRMVAKYGYVTVDREFQFLFNR